jgi:hypothetical protein
MKRQIRFALRLFITASLIAAAIIPSHTRISGAGPARALIAATSDWSRDTASGAFVYYENNGEVTCRPATGEEVFLLEAREPLTPLSVITDRKQGFTPQSDGRLHIILRGTSQLNNFPEARDAFLRAAATWEALLQTSITIVIDVDFGPTQFGQPFPPGVVGLANSQQVGRADFYTDIRNALIGGAGSAQELALYNSLPQASVPTTEGDTNQVFAPSAVLRALGFISAAADPDGERAQLGAPPAISFNSNPGIAYDFDPRDGITAGQIDFEAVAAHEIGHVLGFTSLVGIRELDPDRRVALSLWDIFRFHRGEAVAAGFAPASFTDARRVLSSGGDQVYFAGGEELPLSTGRPDATGGDGFQASHWKDDRFTGRTIGIMDPIITAGDRGAIVDDDVAVLNAIGYGASVADEGAPNISKATYNGSTLTIKGKGITGELQLEINFETVAPPLKIKPKSNGKKAKIKGKQEELNLQSGPNQVRIIKDGLRSNVALLNL